MISLLYRNRLALTLCFVLFTLAEYIGFYFLRGRPELIVLWQLIPPAVSGLILLKAAGRLTGSLRTFWTMLGWSCFFFFAGEFVWLYDLAKAGVNPPVPSLGDLFWNVQCLLYGASLWYLMAKERSVYKGLQFIFDAAMIMIIAGVIIWEYSVMPSYLTFEQTSRCLEVAATIVYPLTAYAGFGGLLVIFFSYRHLFASRVLGLFTVGMLLIAGANTVYFFEVAKNTYTLGSWIDPLYSASMFATALAGVYSSGGAAGSPVKKKEERQTAFRLRLLLPYVFLVVLLFAFAIERFSRLNAFVIGILLLMLVIVIRQVVMLLENDALMRESGKMLETMEHLANHDALSRLPNRRYFELQTAQELEKLHASPQKERMLAVLFIDLDRFKYVNDSYGHGKGDKLIRIAAERIKENADGRMTVARLGGDEFAVLIRDVASAGELTECAQRFVRAIGRPFQLDFIELRVSGSIGIAAYPKDGSSTTQLMKNADAAMYKAKSLGGNRVYSYTGELNSLYARKLAMEQALRKALERDELVLYYQPQFRAADERLVGAEALIRWQTAGGRLVSPADFIPLAEETGLIVPMGEWILRTACRQAAQWVKEGLKPFQMSVNVSPKQFDEDDFTDKVMAILEETGFDPKQLVLEITEGIAMQEESRTVAKLLELKAKGIHISMDDFGTGYSSLGYLKIFQVDSLKIAQTFIREISGDPEQATIVKAILAMADSLKMNVIAEGVETKEQFEFLQSNGCGWIQGYYFNKPLKAEEFELQHVSGRMKTRGAG